MSWEDETVGPDVATAGRLISERIGRDVAAQVDLEGALEAARYSSHPYSSHPKEWPPLIEVADSWELPPVLIERYNAAGGEGTALCGIFPEIRRAWASVDNSLFLWRFDKWDDQCSEYCGEEQAICAVGLVKSKPRVFLEAIQYLLVLATPVELILVGVCCTAREDGLDPYAEISLQPLPEYTIPSDGITMTCVACTDKGNIFLAGRDGHIYEMQYTSGSVWHKRCRKVCLTAGLGSLISRWVIPNVFKFGAVDPIVEMVVDNERLILYARTEGMKLQAFDLGAGGDGLLKKIAEERNLIDPRDGQHGWRSAGSRHTSREAKPSIICIAPLSTLESKWLNLVVVLSDGRRMYLSTTPSGGNNNSIGSLAGLSHTQQRPSCLKVVTTRSSPPLGVGGGLSFGSVSAGRTQTDDLLKAEAAYYSSGTLVISDSSPSTLSSLLIVHRDSSIQSSLPSSFGTSTRSSRALREIVSHVPIEGRLLFVSDVLPLPDMAATIQSLYSDAELSGFESFGQSYEKASSKLWARGDLPTQHILPRRKIVAFSTMGLMELVFNRPVDILRKLFESSAPRSILDDFFNRFGAGEAAAMCLMLAAKLVYVEEGIISNSIAEKAAEAFEDPRIVGMPQLEGSNALTNAQTPPGGFSMGQVVKEAEPIFSGAHEGLCLCSSRLLFPLWELPVVVVRGHVSDGSIERGVIVCRLSIGSMQVLESKIHSLEQFLRSRRNQRRGLYGCISGLGDLTGSILYGTETDIGTGDHSMMRNLFGTYSRGADSVNGATSNKRLRLPYSTAELAAMEVRGMECVRRLLRRSGEALFLLQLLSQHHVTRLVQAFDANMRHQLVQLTFHQLVCSEEGDMLATRLIAGLMEYYVGPDGRGTVDDISGKLREGCPSYYNESDHKFFLAVECLERAIATTNKEEKQSLARDAFNFLTKIPECADLITVCKRFEDLRFYEAVVRLPLQKAQALDPTGDALNEQIDENRRQGALALREQCYQIITNALSKLKGDERQRGAHKEFSSSIKLPSVQPVLDQGSQDSYIRQIVQLSVQWPDKAFHEYLYRKMIDIGLENELLEYGGSDLVPFLQKAGREKTQEETTQQAKHLELLARYYVLKRQHILAAHVLLRLAEKRNTNANVGLTLEQRHQYLSNAVLQARNAANIGSVGVSDNGLLDLIEGKLAVLRFQIKIKEELEAMTTRSEGSLGMDGSVPSDSSPQRAFMVDTNPLYSAREKAEEISQDLKSITQLYNDYAVPFELWEICLEMLHFANYSGGADSSIVRETWARLLDQALSRGGVAEACSVLKRLGSQLYPGGAACLPLNTICLHLEKAALERFVSRAEPLGDDDVARALLAACRDAPEPVLSAYDQLLSNVATLPSPRFRLRLLRSVLVILREWAMIILGQKIGTSATGASLILGGTLKFNQTTTMNQGIQDKITSAANRYMTEVQRLALPKNETDVVYHGFRELEESLLSPFSYERF